MTLNHHKLVVVPFRSLVHHSGHLDTLSHPIKMAYCDHKAEEINPSSALKSQLHIRCSSTLLTVRSMFSMIFGALNGPPRAGQGRAPNEPPDLAALLAELMGPRTGRDGDAVFTQEAFDQVITQLMEQNQGSTAPPPASAEAINALPKKRVTEDMMAEDGKVECSICMDDLEVGAEITVLPCDHWFHPECIKVWLKEHDTCPHCRKPIEDHIAQPTTSSSRRHRTSTGRRPSSVASPRAPRPGDGSAHSPYTTPDSPSGIRERRQQYFNNWNAPDGGDLDRSQSRRSGSAQSTSRPGGERARSQNNTPRGAIGWMRDHMPFGG
jgi:E3 ubiquitin-protein ligase RNF115/126